MSKVCYNFHPATGELIGSEATITSPLEDGAFLVPAFATIFEPPVCGPGEVAIFSSGKWTIRDDFRGVPLFSIADGHAVSITKIGISPADIGATEIPPPVVDCSWTGEAWVLDPAKVAARLAGAKFDAKSRIGALIKARRCELAGSSDETEISGWANKTRIALAVLSGTATAGEIEVFSMEIAVRDVDGEQLVQFAQRVIDKSQAFSKAAGQLDGIKRKLFNRLSDATVLAEVAAITDNASVLIEAALSS